MTRVLRCGSLIGALMLVCLRVHSPSTVDRADATGTLKGDLMEVGYSEIMQHSDFENALYRRVQ